MDRLKCQTDRRIYKRYTERYNRNNERKRKTKKPQRLALSV